MLPRIQSIATVVPDHRISQPQVREFVGQATEKGLPERIAAIYDSTGVESRAIAQPPEFYLGRADFPQRNAVYLAEGQRLLERAAAQALAEARLEPGHIDAIVCVSSTGIATPSIPSQMIAPMGFRTDAQTVPLFGYGCAGGVLGLQVAGDLVRADPSRRVAHRPLRQRTLRRADDSPMARARWCCRRQAMGRPLGLSRSIPGRTAAR